MSKRILFVAGVFAAIVIAAAVWFIGFRGQEKRQVEIEIAKLVKEYDDAINLTPNRETAVGIAKEIVSLADQSNKPN